MNLNSYEVRKLNIGRFLIHAVFLLLVQRVSVCSFDHLFARLRCVWAFIYFALVWLLISALQFIPLLSFVYVEDICLIV